MGFGLIITSNDGKQPLPDDIMQWLVEARVEMELSKPTLFALRFEDDICEDSPAVEGRPELAANTQIGIFVSRNDKLECLVYGPVTEVKSSSVLGGAGSWVEIHGLDRRIEMNRVGVQATYTGRDSDAAAGIFSAYGFKTKIQNTLIEYDDQKNKLTQRATDLAFIEDIARRNNMETWITYEAGTNSIVGNINLTETANLQTSPHRPQPGDVPQIPTLVPDEGRLLKVNPPPDDCPTVNKFEAKIDYEKPTASKGFAMSETEDQAIVEQIVQGAEPVDPAKPVPVDGVTREVISPPASTPEQAFLKKEAIVYEQSWFVGVEFSTTLEQIDFLLFPHQIVDVTHAGERLAGAYQVMKVIHVVTATDHFMDGTLRANGLGGGG